MQDKALKNSMSSNISVWLSNKLSGNDLWINGGSICSQLNKEALRNIKEIFTDLQTQVKLKLLLSFFHIPRRLIDEWKAELDEILEVAAQDQELWVSMLSESMKTYPATGSLNTEISDYEKIFTDMVSELKRLVNKTNDLRMLPLECQYLNKPALTALVGNQPTQMRHFVLKRKPKSTILRTELMQKSADAQSSLKKTSAPTVPLRSRGLPRKMTDTTPLKGIPSRVPSGGFKTPISAQSKNATGINRTTPAGRKDGGVKFLEIEDQPLGYAAAKKRKRQQELEEQQKRAAENEQNVKVGDGITNQATVQTPTTTPDYAAGLAPVVAYTQPATPMPSSTDSPMVSTPLFTTTTQSITTTSSSLIDSSPTSVTTSRELKKENSMISPKRMKFEDDIEEVKAVSPTKQELPVKSVVMTSTKDSTIKGETKIVKVTRTLPTLISNTNIQPQQQQKSIVLTPTTTPVSSSYVTIKAVSAPNNSQPSPLSHLNIPSNTIVRTVQYVTTQAQQNATNNIITTKSPTAVTIQKPTLIAKTNASGKPTILSNIVLTPNTIRTAVPSQQQQLPTSSSGTYVISPNNKIVQRVVVSSGQSLNIPTLTTRTAQPTIIQPMQQGTPTKIVQIKTTPTILGVAQNQNSTVQNIPPLISTQQPTLLNIQNIQNPARKTVTLTAPQQNQQGTQSIQGQKLNQIIMPGGVVKGKTIIVSNQNQNLNLGSRNVILQNVGGAGGTIYQQIPISSVPTNNMTQNVPQLVLSTNAQQNQIQQQTVPRLITNISTLQPQQQTNHVQIRPVLTAVPQGGQLTLIQRPGQQAQLVQASQIVQPQTIQKTIITRPQVVQVQQQTATQTQQVTSQAATGTTIKVSAAGANATGQRRGLSLSSKHVAVASEMFKKANRVTRLDKALILGFMAGYRDNPRPNAENVITIKLNESKEQVKQPDNTVVPMLVDTFIRLDYNSGDWKTFRTFRKITQQQAEAASATQQQQSQSSVVI
ncbi:negative elongation factor A isoform X2 [Chironomus tepperi]|uniref:negative elongation factor A isoform X2 n=1 Tax=Chironomus tepperi TaxID=113505 RepID=UPI00391EF3AE